MSSISYLHSHCQSSAPANLQLKKKATRCAISLHRNIQAIFTCLATSLTYIRDIALETEELFRPFCLCRFDRAACHNNNSALAILFTHRRIRNEAHVKNIPSRNLDRARAESPAIARLDPDAPKCAEYAFYHVYGKTRCSTDFIFEITDCANIITRILRLEAVAIFAAWNRTKSNASHRKDVAIRLYR